MLGDWVKLIRGVPDCASETGNCHCQLTQHAPSEGDNSNATQWPHDDGWICISAPQWGYHITYSKTSSSEKLWRQRPFTALCYMMTLTGVIS
jgi:hypothetical protein